MDIYRITKQITVFFFFLLFWSGIHVLSSQWIMPLNVPSEADQLVCLILLESHALKAVWYSPGGLLFKIGGSNLQHATSLLFLLTVYANYMKAANRVVHCGSNVVITPARLVNFAKGQVDYILGNNLLGMSYMVGYGKKFPRRIHHRSSVLPSMNKHPQHIKCHEGTPYFATKASNQNLLINRCNCGRTS